MRTGTWRTWLAVGILTVLGIQAARAQQTLPPLTRTLPTAPRPVALTSDPPPVPPPTGLAPMPLPKVDGPVAVPIDAPVAHNNGHPIVHTVDGHSDAGETGGLVFWGEYLLLRAHRNAHDFAVSSADRSGVPSGTIESLDWGTQSGYRVGAGWKSCDGIMLSITYTGFHSHDDRDLSVPPGGQLFATLTRSLSIDDVDRAQASSNIDYNIIDLELSNRFEVSRNLDVTLFGGSRIAWIDQKFEAIYNGGSLNAVNSRVSSPTIFHGAGLTVGGEGVWMLVRGRESSGLGLFARPRGSIVSGEFRRSLTETLNNDQVFIVRTNEKSHELVPSLELAAGLSFERERFSLRVGYELMNWFDFVNSPDFNVGGNIGKVGRRTSDLSLEGLSIRLGLNF